MLVGTGRIGSHGTQAEIVEAFQKLFAIVLRSCRGRGTVVDLGTTWVAGVGRSAVVELMTNRGGV